MSERAFYRVLYGLLSRGHEAGSEQAAARAMGLLAMQGGASDCGAVPGHLPTVDQLTKVLKPVGGPSSPEAAQAVLRQMTSSKPEDQEAAAAQAACGAG